MKFTSKNSNYYKMVSLRNNLVIQDINILLHLKGILKLTHNLLLMLEDLSVATTNEHCSIKIYPHYLHHQEHHDTILYGLQHLTTL